MTREQLLDAVGDIRDAFIREAAPPPASYRKQREFPWTGAVAACLALMIVGSTFFLSQMNMGDGATGSGGASAVTEDTAEVGESGGTVNGAADGTDDSEPETAAITVTVDGTVYVQAGGVGRHPEACGGILLRWRGGAAGHRGALSLLCRPGAAGADLCLSELLG